MCDGSPCSLISGLLPAAVLARVEIPEDWSGLSHEDLKREADKRLTQVLKVVESVIETNRRFEAYQVEVQAIAQLWRIHHPSEQSGKLLLHSF